MAKPVGAGESGFFALSADKYEGFDDAKTVPNEVFSVGWRSLKIPLEGIPHGWYSRALGFWVILWPGFSYIRGRPLAVIFVLRLGDKMTPLVSVAITTFNLERWLARALDSVLAQVTDFPIEIVISDDASTDGTLEIARAYRERYPDVIRLFERSKNAGMCRNYYDAFEHCRGKFIAWLDADDYWTDPRKLAIQVQTLESDTSIAACCHLVRWISSDGEVKREIYPAIAPGRYGLAEILHHNFVPSPSVMFRSGLHRQLPPWYFDIAPTTDWPLWVLATLSGDLVLLDRVMADYMLTPKSNFMSKGAQFWHTQDARFYDHVESIVPLQWHRLVRAEKGRRHEFAAYLLRQQGDFDGSREAALKAFLSPSLMDNGKSKTKALLASVFYSRRKYALESKLD